jgi:hypothetical protein
MRNLAELKYVELKTTNYTLRANPKRAGDRRQYLIGIRPRVLERYRRASGGNFAIVVIGDKNVEKDYFVIPFKLVAQVLTDDTLTTEGSGGTRWVVQLIDDQFVVFPKARNKEKVVISGCYSSSLPAKHS